MQKYKKIDIKNVNKVLMDKLPGRARSKGRSTLESANDSSSFANPSQTASFDRARGGSFSREGQSGHQAGYPSGQNRQAAGHSTINSAMSSAFTLSPS